jgi:Tol biopolymer transport system component
LDKFEPEATPETDGASMPFWSPDGHSIGFFASGKLYRIEVAGGPPHALAIASAARGGTWNAEGTIIYSPTAAGELVKISAADAEPAAVTHTAPPRQTSHRSPQFLPDGRHFVFYAQGLPETSGIYLGSLDGGEPKRLGAMGDGSPMRQTNRDTSKSSYNRFRS